MRWTCVYAPSDGVGSRQRPDGCSGTDRVDTEYGHSTTAVSRHRSEGMSLFVVCWHPQLLVTASVHDTQCCSLQYRAGYALYCAEAVSVQLCVKLSVCQVASLTQVSGCGQQLRGCRVVVMYIYFALMSCRLCLVGLGGVLHARVHSKHVAVVHGLSAMSVA